jgi:6-phosphogluconolactonase
MLQVLARAIDARRILEIGTLAGYSAIWLARALPAGGRLVTLELDPERAQIARENLARAGLSERCEVVVGPAADSLDALVRAKTPAFDMIFIDADKESCPRYLARALDLARTGSLIVVDNAISRGRLIDPSTGDAGVNGLRTMMEIVSQHPRLEAACVQTVGAKGYDGFLVATVVDGRRP